MKVSARGIDLIKRFEGCRLEAYQDSAGVWTIGYGLTSDAIPGIRVRKGDKISQTQADVYLIDAVNRFARGVEDALTRQPRQNEFDAMVSLAYNIGLGAFAKSTALKRFNAGDIEGAAEAMTWFNKSGGKVLRGLVRRREAERDFFLADAPEAAETGPVDAPKSAATSTTNMAAGAAGLSIIAGASADARDVIDNLGIPSNVVLLIVGLAAVAWIFRERLKKLAQGV